MADVGTLTKEGAARIRRMEYEAYASDSCRAGVLDRWEAWAILYNAGFRGADLNGFLRHPRP